MAIGPHWPDPAKKIIQFPHRPRAHTPLGEAVSPTGYVILDRLLRRLFRHKDALLRVLDRPEIPLNTNASENDIRAFVTKRKISGGTVSDRGRDARDIMLGLAKGLTRNNRFNEVSFLV